MRWAARRAKCPPAEWPTRTTRPTGTTPPHTTTSGHTSAAATDALVQGSWLWATVWGLLVAALAVAVWALVLRWKGGRRIAAAIVGTLIWLVVVYLFFGALAPLLPASF